MTPETRFLLANCAGSFLLLIVFAALAFLTVASVMFVRGLQEVRRAAPERLDRVTALARTTATQTEQTASSIVTPQIRVASAWTGLRVGVRALISGPSPPREPSEGDDGV